MKKFRNPDILRNAGLALLGLCVIVLALVVLFDRVGDDTPPAAEPPATPTPEPAQGPPFYTVEDLGVRLAYARVDASGAGTLVIQNPDGSAIDVRDARGVFTGIAWSPDGLRVAVSYGPSGDVQDIYIVGVDGRNLSRLTQDGTSRRPTWAPDGETVAFSRGPDSQQGHGPVYRVAAAGGTPAQLSQDARHDNPSWAPDGSVIAASREAGTMVLISPSTGEETRSVDWLRESAPSYTSFDWTSDSTAVAGVVARSRGLAIAVLTDNLTAQRQVGGAFLGNPDDPAWPHPSWVQGFSKLIAASAESGDLLLVDITAEPADMPSRAPYSRVQVLVAAPRGTKLAFPAVSGPRQAGQTGSLVTLPVR